MEGRRTETRKTNPFQTANILSRITFWYTLDLFKKGFKKELEEDDLYEVLPEYETHSVGDRTEQEWEHYKHKKNPLFWVFWKIIGIPYCWLNIIMFIPIILNVFRPFLFGKVVYFFTLGQQDLTKMDGLLYGLLLIGSHLIEIFCRQNYAFRSEVLSIKVRTAICSLIYRKFLKLQTKNLSFVSFGKVTSLITKDINSFELFFFHFGIMWSGIITCMVIFYSMYSTLGLPAIVAMVGFAISIPIQVIFGKWTSYLKDLTSVKTDIRTDALQEVLSNIRTTKMYVWEKFQENRILKARKKEMDILFKMFNVLISTIVLAIIISNTMYYLVLMSCVWFGQTLTAETCYFVTGAFLGLIFNMVVSSPYTTFYSVQVVVAIKRMQSLVQSLDGNSRNEEINSVDEFNSSVKIHLENVTVELCNENIFQNVNIEMDSGLTIITGNTGSGKSLLLLTLLREFDISTGSLFRNGTISYAPQESWLFPSTIKQNIIFGSKYNEKRYQEVIKSCALDYDFNFLENGDSTVIADQGINLSKGQKIRISLARAIYKESDIYLLDDCLSSLDSLVSRQIFFNCILKFLKNKVVVLVTNNLSLLPYAMTVLKLENGGINSIKNVTPQKEIDFEKNIFYQNDFHPENNFENEEELVNGKLLPTKKESEIYKEEKNKGSIPFWIYKTYIDFGGGVLYAFVIFGLFLLTQLALSSRDKTISQWANFENKAVLLNGNDTNETQDLITERNFFLFKYTASTIGICLGTLLRAYVIFMFFKRASLNLHQAMLRRVIGASMKFFDTNFIGNIINRFSKDLVSVDENICFPVHHLTVIIFETSGSILLISTTNVRFLISTILLFVAFIAIRLVYVKTGRPLKRLDAATNSPVIGYLRSTLEGVTSIKVFQAEKILNEEFEKHNNIYNSASFSHCCSLKAFVFFADFITSVFIAVIVLQCFIFEKDMTSGGVGLVLAQAFTIGSCFYFAVFKLGDIETQLTSAERAIEYTKAPLEIKSGLELENWPEKGEIKFENVSLTLNDSKSCLLKDINFLIGSREKIGIVGRTGAGKSSIISTLFRLYNYNGKITIDGVDIKSLSLDFLRSRISIVPQDPVLFGGTVRENMDPDGTHGDGEIWNAVEAVQLKQIILDLDVNIKTLNLSDCQKRLMCLARVLLKNNKILLLDEVVENADLATENLIYQIIDKYFRKYTVIIVAHRLQFIRSCDKIIVLENGEIVEFDSPNVLLQNNNGLFYKMAYELLS